MYDYITFQRCITGESYSEMGASELRMGYSKPFQTLEYNLERIAILLFLTLVLASRSHFSFNASITTIVCLSKIPKEQAVSKSAGFEREGEMQHRKEISPVAAEGEDSAVS